MTQRYTAAVVGGGTGGKLSLAALEASTNFELRAVADLRADVLAELQALYPHIQTFPTYGEMFAACPTDVVCIATYPPSHLEITQAALHLSLQGILVEKPLGDTYAAGKQIVRAIKAQQLPAVVPHGLLVAPHVDEICALVHGGAIGELELVEIESHRWDIINAGIHWLNLFVALTPDDPVDYVLATCDSSTRTYRDGMQVETLAVTYAQTRRGVRVVMQTGDHVPIMRRNKPFLFRLIGTAGMIEMYAWESAYHLLNAQHPNGQSFEVTHDGRSGHQRHLDQLALQIEQGAADYQVLDSSLVALELCEAAYRSSAEHCCVRLPLDTFEAPASGDWMPGTPYSGHGGGRDGREL